MGHEMAVDGPMSLIPTPYSLTGKDGPFTREGSEMALFHNVLIRGYNSIYLQASHVKPRDVVDFCHYIEAWVIMIQKHHEGEDIILFPGIEVATKQKGIMGTQSEEHAAFDDGLHQVESLSQRVIKQPDIWQPKELIAILDELGPVLNKHLATEPTMLASLACYDFDLNGLMKKAGDHGLAVLSPVNHLPFVWFNMDVDFEDGQWRDFPVGAPWHIKFLMTYVFPLWRPGWWRFGSSATDGKQRPLLCLTPGYTAT